MSKWNRHLSAVWSSQNKASDNGHLPHFKLSTIFSDLSICGDFNRVHIVPPFRNTTQNSKTKTFPRLLSRDLMEKKNERGTVMFSQFITEVFCLSLDLQTPSNTMYLGWFLGKRRAFSVDFALLWRIEPLILLTVASALSGLHREPINSYLSKSFVLNSF